LDLGPTSRAAIVAPASKGLGRSVAEEHAREGASVAVCAHTRATLDETALHIHEFTSREVFRQALDVADSAPVAAFVAAVEARFGHIDICVTNSGAPPSNLVKKTQLKDWRAAIDQLLMSAVNFAREVLPRMQKNTWGRLITITSPTVKQLSNSIRAAVTALARTLANGWEREIPAGRFDTLEEFGAVVGFLASECASYANGGSIAVDCGLVRSLL
jgi:3-oxoacyl-[acyl-carrier protein] reductase